MKPRNADAGLIIKKGQLETKKRATVDREWTDTLMVQEHGYIILDDPITVEEFVRGCIGLVINVHRNGSIGEVNLRDVR